MQREHFEQTVEIVHRDSLLLRLLLQRVCLVTVYSLAAVYCSCNRLLRTCLLHCTGLAKAICREAAYKRLAGKSPSKPRFCLSSGRFATHFVLVILLQILQILVCSDIYLVAVACQNLSVFGAVKSKHFVSNKANNLCRLLQTWPPLPYTILNNLCQNV